MEDNICISDDISIKQEIEDDFEVENNETSSETLTEPSTSNTVCNDESTIPYEAIKEEVLENPSEINYDEIGEFCFESDHLALKSNNDYKNLLEESTMATRKNKAKTGKNLAKRRERQKLSMRVSRLKLRENPEKLEEVKRRDRERKRALRKRVSEMTEDERKKIREQWRTYTKKYRKKKKEGNDSDLSIIPVVQNLTYPTPVNLPSTSKIINERESETVIEVNKKSDTEKDLVKRRESKKLSMRVSRLKLKENPEKFEEVKRRDRERKKALRKKISEMTEEEKKKIREQWRTFTKKYRKKKKENNSSDLRNILPVVPNVSYSTHINMPSTSKNINESEMVIEVKKKINTEKKLAKRRESQKLSMRVARLKLKENPEMFEEAKRRDRERKKVLRKSISEMTDDEKIKVREQWRTCSKMHRKKKKEENSTDLSNILPVSQNLSYPTPVNLPSTSKMINESETVIEIQKNIETEKTLTKRRESKKLSMRVARLKLKENPEMFAEAKRKEREQKKVLRKNISEMTEDEKSKIRKQWRIRSKMYREKKMENCCDCRNIHSVSENLSF